MPMIPTDPSIDTLADASVEKTHEITERMRQLYREAEHHRTFITLDMQEYRDQDLTVTAFRQVLSEPEFARVNAGIVLQAYLPESIDAVESAGARRSGLMDPRMS